MNEMDEVVLARLQSWSKSRGYTELGGAPQKWERHPDGLWRSFFVDWNATISCVFDDAAHAYRVGIEVEDDFSEVRKAVDRVIDLGRYMNGEVS